MSQKSSFWLCPGIEFWGLIDSFPWIWRVNYGGEFVVLCLGVHFCLIPLLDYSQPIDRFIIFWKLQANIKTQALIGHSTINLKALNKESSSELDEIGER